MYKKISEKQHFSKNFKAQTLWDGQKIWKNIPLVLTKQLASKQVGFDAVQIYLFLFFVRSYFRNANT